MENMGAGVIIVDALTHVIEKVNPTTADLFGTSEDMIQGKVCHKFLCPAEENACPITDLHQVVDKSDRTLLRSDGTKVPIIKTVKRIQIEGRDKLVESFIDITDRNKAEEALRESEEKFRGITEQSADGIVVTDENGCIVEWNKAQVVFTGCKRADVLNKPLWEVQCRFSTDGGEKGDIRGVIQKEVEAFLRGDRDWKEKRERNIALPNGSKRTIAESAFLVRQNGRNMGVFVVNNVTEKKEAEISKSQYEAYMHQAQRLESLGILAAGIAHDFNNILMGVFGYTELARGQTKDPLANEYLAQAAESMERARGLTQQLLTFAKGGAPIPARHGCFATDQGDVHVCTARIERHVRCRNRRRPEAFERGQEPDRASDSEPYAECRSSDAHGRINTCESSKHHSPGERTPDTG